MPTTLIDLEQALRRYGDELYRLALLLTPDDAGAAALLVGTAHHLAADPAERFDEPALFAALAAALPPERKRWRRQRPPRWTKPPSMAADTAPLPVQIARLPRPQRLALGMAMLPGLDPEHATPIFEGGELQARGAIRDALLALAPDAVPDLDLAELGLEDAPPNCQPTRAALALGAGQVHDDSALRGHLALCDGCRAAERGWQALYGAVEYALRGALRDMRLPGALAAQMRAALRPQPPANVQTLIADPRARLGLVACVVLALIALLVLPHHPAADSGGATAGATTSPRELLSRAQDNLYAVPPGSGVWHGRWEMRWGFPGGSYAPLAGDLWIDTTTGRHRVQLAHQEGGGPYEFELGDGERDLWYAATATYGPSLYPLLFDPNHARVHLQLPAAEQQRMLRERLNSGAWGLAAAYLRQAQAASGLRSWGRQRTPDGTTVEVLGFRGASPLALPPDAPDATASQATVLLMIEPQSGTLREVRELLGQEGSEQTGRVTWRFVSGGWIDSSAEIVRAFDRGQAWNGIGDFVDQAGVADPALPLAPARAAVPLAQGIETVWLPTEVPTGTLRAVLIDRNWQRNSPDPPLNAMDLASFYIGTGRRMTIWTQSNAEDRDMPPASERVVLNGKPFGLEAGAAQSYRATLLHQGWTSGQLSITWTSAFGYTRAELLDTLGGIDLPSTVTYYAQAHLFSAPAPADPAAFEALLQALKPAQPAPGTARHYVERVFARQSREPDPLPDPYHLPRYRGWTEQVTIDNWEHTNVVSGTQEAIATTRGADGTLYAQQYLGAAEVWYYDAKTSTTNRFRRDLLGLENRTNSDLMTVLRMIACGNSRLATLPDGTRVVTASATLYQPGNVCRNARYENLLQQEQQDPIRSDAPDLLDVADQPITTWLYLGAEGRPARIEVRAGTARDGILLESWELLSDERVSEERVPAGTFDARPPQALAVGDYTAPFTNSLIFAPQPIELLDALKRMTTPIFMIPNDAQTKLAHINVSSTLVTEQRDQIDPDQIGVDPLWRGLALQFTYTLSDGLSFEQMQVYEGSAKQFGAYLRARLPIWQQSASIELTIDGRALSGWQLTGVGSAQQQWVVLEADGTLLALEDDTPMQHAAIGRLHRLNAP